MISRMKKHTGSLTLILTALVCAFAAPFATAHAQNATVAVQAPKDAWQVRRSDTHALIRTISTPNVDSAQRDQALTAFDARLTDADRGRLTPIETLELFGVFYVPRELQQKSDPAMLMQVIAAKATLGWYDALRFADESGRAEITNNEGFFTLAFGKNHQVFVDFAKAQPQRVAQAVQKGIQMARDQVAAKNIAYDPTWPASYGMLRMQCGLRKATTCERPQSRPEQDWPALFDLAAQRVTAVYGTKP